MNVKFKLGELVCSTAGRDTGNCYIVVGIMGDRFVKVADGKYKRIEYPKRKNIKHLKFTGYFNEELSIWLAEGKRVRNEDLRNIIKDYQNEEAN